MPYTNLSSKELDRFYRITDGSVQKAYENLANAVVQMACEDYMRAWKRFGNTWNGFKESGMLISAKGLEKWFKSPDYTRYSTIDGEYMVDHLQEKLEEEKYEHGRLQYD